MLKDASAATIYEARGANGVILITTKQGGEQERVSYDGSISTTNAVDTRDVLGAQQYRDVVADQFPSLTSALGEANTDWQDAVLDRALGQQHSVSFSGGSASGEQYRFSLGYQSEEGVLRTSQTQRTNLSAKYTRPFFDDRLTLDANLRGSKTNDQFAPSVIETAALFAPTQPIRDASNARTGYFEWSGFSEVNSENNPVATIDLTDEAGDSYRSVGNAELEYEPAFVFGLSFAVIPLMRRHSMSAGQALRTIWFGEVVSIAVMELVMNAVDHWFGGMQVGSLREPVFWIGLAVAVPAGFVGIRGPFRSDQMAGFSRIQRPPFPRKGHCVTDARDRTRKVGQIRSLIASSSDANPCVLHDKVWLAA
jgi:TonB-dependent SusC/RagA subfamily outer membrane receptor